MTLKRLPMLPRKGKSTNSSALRSRGLRRSSVTYTRYAPSSLLATQTQDESLCEVTYAREHRNQLSKYAKITAVTVIAVTMTMNSRGVQSRLRKRMGLSLLSLFLRCFHRSFEQMNCPKVNRCAPAVVGVYLLSWSKGASVHGVNFVGLRLGF